MKHFMKQIVTFVLVVGMVLAIPFGVHAEELGFAAVTDVVWDSSSPGYLTMNNTNTENLYYSLKLFKDDSNVTTIEYKDAFSTGTLSFDLRDDINESGTYKVQVYVYRNEDDINDVTKYVMTESDNFVYDKPTESLATPQNVKWSTTQAGTITWSPVEEADFYEIEIFKNKEDIYNAYYSFYHPSTLCLSGTVCTYDVSRVLVENGQYKATVRAISADISTKANGIQSDFSDVLFTGDVNQVTKTKLEGLLTVNNKSVSDSSTKDEVKGVVSNIKTTFSGDNQSDLAIGMQTDSDILSKIETVEELYKYKNAVTVNQTVDSEVNIDADKVKIVGAALNADPSDTVNFSIEQPEEQAKINVDSNRYKNAVQFSLNLAIGETPKDTLDVPITITMPIPAGINPSKLEILHYTASQTYETIYPRINGDGTCTFTITHFSEFVFAEGNGIQVVEDSDEPTIEFWKPTTPEDIYRYSLLGHENNAYTVKEGLPYAVKIKNDVQGQLFFNAINTIAKDYTLVRTYNILPDNKKQFTMQDKATITLTIPEYLQKDGRNWCLFGAKQDGTPYILKDLDKNKSTITISTNEFYAFALGYKGK